MGTSDSIDLGAPPPPPPPALTPTLSQRERGKTSPLHLFQAASGLCKGLE